MTPEAFLALDGGSVTVSTILTVAAACSGGGVATVIQWLANRGKTSAEEIEIWTRSSVTRLHTMHEEMTLLEQRIRSLTTELDHERATRLACTSQLRHATELLARNGIVIDPPFS
jgi:hypothetical protein